MSAHEDEPGKVVSLSGSPIYRHSEPKPWAPPAQEGAAEEISAHIERHLGPVDTVFHEIVSDKVHIDVHFVKPTPDTPYIRLITSGMSDLPMTTPDDNEIPKYAELLITLPANWRLTQADFEDENWYWPIRLIKYLARLPHEYATWLGWGHTVPNGDPPEPYASGVKFSGAVVVPSVTVPSEFKTLEIDEKKTISFFSVVPLYEEEMNLKLRSGLNELLDKFDKRGINDIVDPKRRNVATKRFGLW